MNDLEVTEEDNGIKIHYSVGVSENSPKVKNVIWRKNDQLLDIKYDKLFGGGFKDSCLVIRSPSEDDKGTYSCTVTNAVGSVTKDIKLGRLQFVVMHYILPFNYVRILQFSVNNCIVGLYLRNK